MRTQVLLPLVALSAALAGCVAEPPRHYHRYRQPPPPPAAPAPRMPELIVYPARGQAPEQLDRDRYECHNWAVKQTGYDPSVAVAPAPAPRVRVVDQPPPGSGVAAGAITGAVLGAIVSGRGHEGGGAAVGAVAGAMVGGASEQAQRDAARADEDQANASLAAQSAPPQERAGSYRRAISACLEARGYTVK